MEAGHYCSSASDAYYCAVHPGCRLTRPTALDVVVRKDSHLKSNRWNRPVRYFCVELETTLLGWLSRPYISTPVLNRCLPQEDQYFEQRCNIQARLLLLTAAHATIHGVAPLFSEVAQLWELKTSPKNQSGQNFDCCCGMTIPMYVA